ncbi:protein DGS1, mitochondrial isoform X2 [Arabidopsis lyrata subsp. lyrata]|uniref:protein DGS1, mitochondrial isoform X2 n=1 Tax=Arabidopsis lyrata subsp. lyrata TaxID=81972 RepID=UPI000A29E06B|nr:protein DGS1, mitochondrial isoform X2 [Arabidopsis lyrata subsp. lyrata]|eukprot:XP_020889019.1 protein DGS1, mitochondrial isoform X2 [Arabidopsis lyrata subsp. lyrata]
MANAITFFELNTGVKFPSVGLGTWQASPGLVGDAVAAAVKDKDAETVFGLLIYSLERLYRVVEKPARATDEVKQDLIELGRPQQQTSYKLTVTQRLVTVYDCLLPTRKRQ